LIEQCVVEVYLEHGWFHATANEILVLADVELDLNQCILAIDRVNQLWLVDITKGLIVESVTDGVENGRLTSSVLSYDKSIAV
jgi:hypothetical protein